MGRWTYLRQVGEQTSEASEIHQLPSPPHYMVSTLVNTSNFNTVPKQRQWHTIIFIVCRSFKTLMEPSVYYEHIFYPCKWIV